MAWAGFGWGDFLGRWGAALALVLLTFNPFGFSYWHWVTSGTGEEMQAATDGWPLKVFAGLLLLTGFIIFLRATFRSIGAFGVILVSALFATLIWMLVDFGWISVESDRMMTMLVLILASLVLGIGMSWSHIRRRLSGQFDTDDVDEE